MDQTFAIPFEPVHKSRRAHTKSRKGCVGCKQRRKKCDELFPRCSRCVERDLRCQYPNGLTIDGPNHSTSSFTGGLPALGPSSPSLHQDEGEDPHDISKSPLTLDRTELELLSHYLLHTSRIIALDRDELHALQMGMPHLAYHSKPLMSSIIALAATCCCHDIIARPGPLQPRRGQLVDLLLLADRHHKQSLQHIQAFIMDSVHYDSVLANAALMVLYASANHCIRIRLEETVGEDMALPRELWPSQPQWISLIRAAHMAVVGLLNDQPETPNTGPRRAKRPTSASLADIGWQAANARFPAPLEDCSTESTGNLMRPILAATSSPAFERLNTRIRRATETDRENLSSANVGASSVEQHPVADDNFDLQACFASLEILRRIFAEVLAVDDVSSPLTESSNDQDLERQYYSLGQLSQVSPWLRSYMTRVTSMTKTPRPLRRTVMAFLNRVPAAYLRLVQQAFDHILARRGSDEETGWEHMDRDLPELTFPCGVAIDIFAHWLVLVVLLDDVWWIGGIGIWELGRVVSLLRSPGTSSFLVDMDEDWWPEIMYNVGRELRKQTDRR